MTQKLNIIIFFFVILFLSCENEQLKFNAPSANLLEAKKVNNNTGYIKYHIKKGYGVKIKELYAEFYDITDTTIQVIKENLQIKDSVQFTDSALLSNLKNKHDYRVIVKLISDKNEYKSTSKIISLSSNYDESFLGILSCDLYISPNEEMYLEEYNGYLVKPLRKGQYFLVDIYFSDTFISKNKYEFRLNGNISLKTEATYDSYSNYISWGMNMPDNIPSGVYTLDMYVNGNKITSHTKIRVLSGIYSERVIPLMPIVYVPSYDANEFILHDKIYYMCGRLIYTWDLKNNNWTKKNDLNVNNGNEYSSVIDANFNYDNSQYVFIQKYSGNNGDISKLQLMKYNETQDNWQFITEFPDEFPPVIGNRIFTFILGDCLYLGYKKSDYKDLWEFNFKTNSWTKKNKLPDGMHGFVSDDCSFETTGFIITNFRELWQYNPSSDSWQLLTTLEAGPYIRYDTRLIYNNGFIYVLGGKTGNDEDYLADFWRYNLSTKLWDYIWLCQFTYNCTAPKFIYNNKILMIPGFNYDYNSNYSAEITL